MVSQMANMTTMFTTIQTDMHDMNSKIGMMTERIESMEALKTGGEVGVQQPHGN